MPSLLDAPLEQRALATPALALISGVCLAGTLFPHQPGAALLLVAASAAIALSDLRRAEVIALPAIERWAPCVVGLFFVPLLAHAVAPGADMAMHAALARALRDNTGALSPAWGDVRAAAYPLGFSAWIALFGTVTDLGTASVIASAAAFALFYLALARFSEHVLGATQPRTLSALLLTASWTPQAFYRWGGGPSVLAMALGLYAASELRTARHGACVALLLTAAMTTHPIGASIGAACSGAVLLQRCAREPRAWWLGWVFVPLALVMVWLSFAGPTLSEHEHAWIHHFRTVDENVLGNWPRWLFPFSVWRAVTVRVGPVVALCYLWSCVVLWRREPRSVRWSLASIVAFGALLAYGPELPALGLLVYPSRWMLVALLLMAAPLDRALTQASVRARCVLAIAALGVHTGLYQAAEPMVTRNDAAALRCLAANVPEDAVIDGAYGDATQWIPALTGRAITHPHEHCSLFDEVAAALRHQHATHRFIGERTSFGEPLSTPLPHATLLCRHGRARLYKLQ